VESLENSQSEFPTLSTALGNPAEAPDFHISTAPEAGFYSQGGREEKMEPKPNSS
jgi:hypothetical protein